MKITRPLLASAAMLGGILLAPSVAGAETCTYPEQCTSTFSAPINGRAAAPVAAQAPAPAQARAASSGSLPVTGGDVTGLAVLGAAAVGAGSVVTVVARRKAARAN